MAESEFNVDEAEAAYNSARGEEEGTPPLPVVEELDADGQPVADDPPGFKSYEEYVADGGDPDMYRGRKAYAAEHNRIDENKRLRKDVKGLQSTVQQTMDAVNSWQEVERGKIRKEVEAELNEAMENEDPKAAVAAQKRLDQIDDLPASPAPVTRKESPVIEAFREANPIINGDADDFDEEFNADVEAFYNTTYSTLSNQGRKQLTDGQIKRALNKALKDAKELHGDDGGAADDNARGESPRNSRPASTARTNRRTAPTPADARAEDYQIENPRNPRQKNAAPEVRDMIHKTAFDNARKHGKSEADATKEADAAAKNFEKSLNS